MTRVVVLDTAPPATAYDEITLFNKALGAADMAALAAAQNINFTEDPQASVGWEELYGNEQPKTPGDVPVMANGLCRVRWIAAASVFAVDNYVPGVGYIEQGRVSVWHDDNGTLTQHGTLRSVDLLSWTSERAVLRVITTAISGANTYRMETYVTVHRGGTGPRFECYPSPGLSGANLGAHIRWAPYQPTDPFALTIGNAARPFYQSDQGVAWAGGPDDFTGVGSEPWLAQIGGDRMTAIAVSRVADRIRRYDDTGSYGSTRKAVAVCADYGTAQAGYVCAYFGFAQPGSLREAEAFINAGGTRTSVADAAASGGTAINDTQVANNAPSYSVPAASVVPGPGKYAVYVKVRATTAGDTLSAAARFGAQAYTAPVTTTSQNYVWLYAGEATRQDVTQGLDVAVWRSAGAGATGVRLDRVALVPVEQRTTVPPAYDGARDLGQAHLLDTRSIPTLISRS